MTTTDKELLEYCDYVLSVDGRLNFHKEGLVRLATELKRRIETGEREKALLKATREHVRGIENMVEQELIDALAAYEKEEGK